MIADSPLMQRALVQIRSVDRNDKMMNFQKIKPLFPPRLWRTLKVISRLDDGARMTRAYELARHAGDLSRLYFNDDIWVRSPDRALPHEMFRAHFYQRELRQELEGFLKLARGKTRFLDIGASGGVFSALFARSRPRYDVLSIEPDPPSHAVLETVRELNSSSDQQWRISDVAISDRAAEVQFASSGYAGEFVDGGGAEGMMHYAERQNMDYSVITVKTETLQSCCERHNFNPDIIKLDVESFEHEVIESSVEVLRRYRPAIHLELHNDKLRSRGIDPAGVLRVLAELGYRLLSGGASLADRASGLARPGIIRIEIEA